MVPVHLKSMAKLSLDLLKFQILFMKTVVMKCFPFFVYLFFSTFVVSLSDTSSKIGSIPRPHDTITACSFSTFSQTLSNSLFITNPSATLSHSRFSINSHESYDATQRTPSQIHA